MRERRVQLLAKIAQLHIIRVLARLCFIGDVRASDHCAQLCHLCIEGRNAPLILCRSPLPLDRPRVAPAPEAGPAAVPHQKHPPMTAVRRQLGREGLP